MSNGLEVTGDVYADSMSISGNVTMTNVNVDGTGTLRDVLSCSTMNVSNLEVLNISTFGDMFIVDAVTNSENFYVSGESSFGGNLFSNTSTLVSNLDVSILESNNLFSSYSNINNLIQTNVATFNILLAESLVSISGNLEVNGAVSIGSILDVSDVNVGILEVNGLSTFSNASLSGLGTNKITDVVSLGLINCTSGTFNGYTSNFGGNININEFSFNNTFPATVSATLSGMVADPATTAIVSKLRVDSISDDTQFWNLNSSYIENSDSIKFLLSPFPAKYDASSFTAVTTGAIALSFIFLNNA